MRTRLFVSCTLATLASATTAAHAQNADAEALFRQGIQLETAGKLVEACDAYAASNRIEQRAGTLLRLGECRMKNHQLASAWAAFSDSLARAKDPAKKRLAEAALKEIEPRLSYLTVSVPEESQVTGLGLTRDGEPFDPMLWNRAIPVDGGKIVIGGHAPGHEEWKATVDIPFEHGNVHIDVPKFKELAQLITPPPGGAAAPAAKPSADAAVEDELPIAAPPSKKMRYVAYGLAGGSVVLGAAAVVLEIAARSKISSAEHLCGADFHCREPAYSQTNSLLHQAALRRDGAIAGGVLAIASAGAATYLYLRTRRVEHARHAVRVTPAADRQALAVFVDGSF